LINTIRYAPNRINADPVSCKEVTGSLSHRTPKNNEITGDRSNIVEAFDRLMYFNPQYHVRTYRNRKDPETAMYVNCWTVSARSNGSLSVISIMENKTREPKNILEKVTTQLLSLFNIAFFEITFSTAQSIVAAKTKKSPVLISAERFCICIRINPNNIIPIASSCCFVIFSFRNMKANMSA